MRSVQFPQDELSHHNIIEWWYFHGHLFDQKKNEYGFMISFFKINTKKVDLANLVPFHFFRRLIRLIDGHIIHFQLSDLKNKKFYSQFVHLPEKVPFYYFENEKNLELNYGFSHLKKINFSDYSLRFKKSGLYLDLNLKNTKAPLFNGPKNRGYLSFNKKYSYYYSLSRLQAQGVIGFDGQKKKISGQAWMDHQWGDFSIIGSRWTWFGIQLADQTEYMLFDLYDQKKKRCHYHINVSRPDGSQDAIENFSLKPCQFWTSSKTKKTYPIAWHLKFKDKKTVKLEIKSLLRDQEMFDPRTAPYYEGNCRVTGKTGSKKVTGRAYAEVVDYDTQWLEKYFHFNLLKKIKKKL